jgi:hypothetical protein
MSADITELKAKVHGKVYDVLREAGVGGELSAEIAGKAAQAVGTDVRAEIKAIDARLTALEEAWRRLNEECGEMLEEQRQREGEPGTAIRPGEVDATP